MLPRRWEHLVQIKDLLNLRYIMTRPLGRAAVALVLSGDAASF
jgi:hypothetical protein